MPTSKGRVTYTAAGGVVLSPTGDQILLLIRPERDEVRLPKGHVDEGEDPQETALREVCEESGYCNLEIRNDLGQQLITFLYQGQIVQRTERYFLMRARSLKRIDRPETDARQFFTIWVTWAEAKEHLTFEAEREWIQRACRVLEKSQ